MLLKISYELWYEMSLIYSIMILFTFVVVVDFAREKKYNATQLFYNIQYTV